MKTTFFLDTIKQGIGPSQKRSKTLYFRSFALLAAATLVFGSISCGGPNVKSDYDHKVNFSQFHTYSWGNVKTVNPLYVSRIKDAVNNDLQAKSWQMVSSGGDTTIFATGQVNNQQQLETVYRGFGGDWGGGWGWSDWGWGDTGGFGRYVTTTRNVKVGNLVIDIFEPNNKKLIWRGIISGKVSKGTQENTKDLTQGIDELFKKFPPNNANG
ncbi:MAG: DUF4136 domain-containing protein [Segetibacter sp.]